MFAPHVLLELAPLGIFGLHVPKDLGGCGMSFAAFLVPTDRDGVDIGAESATLGLRGIVQNQVRLNGVVVSARDMLGQPGQVMEVANTAMQLGRLGIGAISIGALKRVLQLGLLFATRRQIAARPLADRLAVRAALRDCDTETAFFEAVLTFLARRMDDGQPLPEYFAVALKIISTERAWRWADFAVQIVGGRGYDEANQLARILRDVRILRIFEGPTEALQADLGTTLLFGFRPLREAFHAVAGDSEAANAAVRDLEAVRSETLS